MKKTLIIAAAASLAMSTGVEEQDNELFMNAVKNGYYTATNAILSRPAMIANTMQMVQNGMGRPSVFSLFDDEAADNNLAFADDNLAIEEFADDNLALEDAQDDELFMNTVKNGYYTATNAILSRPAMIANTMQMVQNGMGRPSVFSLFDDEAADNNLALEDAQDDELFMNTIKNGYYTATNAILSRPAMIANTMQMVQNGMGRPSVFSLFDDEAADNNLALEDAQDDELFMNAVKNGYYTATNAILSRPAMIANTMQMVQNGMGRPSVFSLFDDELRAEEGTKKTEKGEKSKEKRRRERLERPENKIKRNTKFRVPKDVAADNTLFDLAELLEDN